MKKVYSNPEMELLTIAQVETVATESAIEPAVELENVIAHNDL